jgi:hypothetical protein
MSNTSKAVFAKGSNFIGLLAASEARFGADTRARVLAQLPSDAATALADNHVLAMGWYSVEWYAQLHAAIDRTFSGGAAAARALGHDATLADFTGMHRLIGSVLTVHTVFSQSHRLMGLYWRGGSIERLELTQSHVRLRFEGWPGFTLLVWEDIMGSLEALLEVCRAKHIRCRPVGSVAPSGPVESIEIEARWAV